MIDLTYKLLWKPYEEQKALVLKWLKLDVVTDSEAMELLGMIEDGALDHYEEYLGRHGVKGPQDFFK